MSRVSFTVAVGRLLSRMPRAVLVPWLGSSSLTRNWVVGVQVVSLSALPVWLVLRNSTSAVSLSERSAVAVPLLPPML